MSEMPKNPETLNEDKLTTVSGGVEGNVTNPRYQIGQRIRCRTPFFRVEDEPTEIEACIIGIVQDYRGVVYRIECEYEGQKRTSMIFEDDVLCVL